MAWWLQHGGRTTVCIFFMIKTFFMPQKCLCVGSDMLVGFWFLQVTVLQSDQIKYCLNVDFGNYIFFCIFLGSDLVWPSII